MFHFMNFFSWHLAKELNVSLKVLLLFMIFNDLNGFGDFMAGSLYGPLKEIPMKIDG